MPNIYLLRHCDYENPRQILPGRLPLELSESGKKRASQLKEIFKDKSISKIYSSEVLRCKQTAEIIADGKIPIIFDKRLLGTHLDVQTRTADFYEEIKKKLGSDENAIICSHGDPLQTIYAHVYNLKISNDKHLPEIKEFGWLKRGEFFKINLS